MVQNRRMIRAKPATPGLTASTLESASKYRSVTQNDPDDQTPAKNFVSVPYLGFSSFVIAHRKGFAASHFLLRPVSGQFALLCSSRPMGDVHDGAPSLPFPCSCVDIRCGICKNFLQEGDPYYHCNVPKCHFDMCQNCYFDEEYHKHVLQKMKGILVGTQTEFTAMVLTPFREGKLYLQRSTNAELCPCRGISHCPSRLTDHQKAQNYSRSIVLLSFWFR